MGVDIHTRNLSLWTGVVKRALLRRSYTFLEQEEDFADCVLEGLELGIDSILKWNNQVVRRDGGPRVVFKTPFNMFFAEIGPIQSDDIAVKVADKLLDKDYGYDMFEDDTCVEYELNELRGNLRATITLSAVLIPEEDRRGIDQQNTWEFQIVFLVPDDFVFPLE